MEKLLRLLNIYAHAFLETNLRFTYDGNHLRVQGDEIGPYVAESIVINKKFGFIERLVKNDKIDFKSENYLLKSYDGYFDDDILCIVSQDCNTYEDRIKVQFNKIDSLIMYLSIQDNPLDYLCSILKE